MASLWRLQNCVPIKIIFSQELLPVILALARCCRANLMRIQSVIAVKKHGHQEPETEHSLSILLLAKKLSLDQIARYVSFGA